MDIQKLLDAISDASRRTRSDYHLTLGKLIAALKEMPHDMPVYFDWNHLVPGRPDSYRGYYADLAFEWEPKERTVAGLLDDCEEALDAAFDGYKGGEYVMDADTPLWAAQYGETIGARAITGIAVHGDHAVLATRELDDH